jgi:glycosyltransferase involved in cell wall biosynthesis
LDGFGDSFTRYFVHLLMPRWERAIAPQISFAPGGPVYWRARARQVVAFALPHLIYPETDIYRNVRYRDRPRLRLLLRRARHSFVQADSLVVQTETVRERASRFLPFPLERILVVKNSYSPAFLAALNAAQVVRPDRFVVLIPSAYYAHKNLESTVAVASELQKGGLRDIEFRFTLPVESRGWRTIKSLADNAGVGSMITARGNVDHAKLAREYREADIVFLPTFLECSTAVYPESFIAGKPLVTSNLDFARELCGDAARFVNPHDPADMAGAIRDLFRDERSRNELVAAGRRVLTEHYVTPEQKWRAQLRYITAET